MDVPIKTNWKTGHRRKGRMETWRERGRRRREEGRGRREGKEGEEREREGETDRQRGRENVNVNINMRARQQQSSWMEETGSEVLGLSSLSFVFLNNLQC